MNAKAVCDEFLIKQGGLWARNLQITCLIS